MKILTCGFCGHRDAPGELYERVHSAVEELIVCQGVGRFYCGDKGNFDRIAAQAVRNLQNRYPHIRLYKVLAYYPMDQTPPDNRFDGTIYPEGLETVPPRYAISRRNRWMAAQIDFLVAYVQRAGGAREMLDHAVRLGRARILNLAEEPLGCPLFSTRYP